MLPATSLSAKNPATETLDYAVSALGHRIRRVHQIGVSLFNEEVAALGLTPVQYVALAAIVADDEADATRIAEIAHTDRSTMGSVVERLEAKGFIERGYRPNDKRTKRLSATALGRAVLERSDTAVRRSQERLMNGLDPAARQALMSMLDVIIAGHEGRDGGE
jgi:DNA-binding MarR family transcriptional regulator